MIKELEHLYRIYRRMGFEPDDARQASIYEYKYNKNIRPLERVTDTEANKNSRSQRKHKAKTSTQRR